MRRLTLAAALVPLIGIGVAALFSQAPAGAAAADVGTAISSADAERGRYLVHEVAMCVQCHSPRDRQGNLLRDRLLEGGPVPVRSPFEGQRWAFQAPNLHRAPGYAEEELVRLLTQGKTRDGRTPRPPMPPFRMTAEDARAIFSYLRTL